MISTPKKIIYNFLFPRKITINSTSELEGKVILITGASRGIGKNIAEVLYSQGATIACISRNKKDLEKIFATFDKKRTLFLETDITKESDCQKAIAQVVKNFGRIDVLINNAGIFSGKQFELTSDSEWQNGIKTNISSIFYMTKAVVPTMKKQKNGHIITIGSKVSRNTNVSAKMVLYATTKYAVEGFCYALGRELKAFGIRVNCIMPGTVDTVPSLNSLDLLSPLRIAQLIGFIITLEDVDFENIVIKSKYQTNL